MSAFFQGLLQGASKGLAEVGTAMFQDAISAKKEERLAKIADRNYQRDREDTLSDIESQRDFQGGLLKSIETDDAGNVFGFSGDGTRIELGTSKTISPLLKSTQRAAESSQAELQRLGIETRDENTFLWDAHQRNLADYESALDDSYKRLGMERTPISSPGDITEQDIIEQGELLFRGGGTVMYGGRPLTGSSLQEARKNFMNTYPSIYQSRFSPGNG